MRDSEFKERGMAVTIADIQTATIGARSRTGDGSISTKVSKGLFQIVRVEYPAGRRGRSVVTPCSEWLSPSELVANLESMQ